MVAPPLSVILGGIGLVRDRPRRWAVAAMVAGGLTFLLWLFTLVQIVCA